MAELSVFEVFLPHVIALSGSVLAVALDAGSMRRAAAAAVVFGLAAAAVVAGFATGGPIVVTDGIAVSGGGYSVVVAALFALGALGVVGAWRRYRTDEMGGGVAALSGMMVTASCALVYAADLLILLICVEILAVTSYVLVWQTRSKRGVEAAIKYYVQGAVATGLFLLGMAIVLVSTGGETSYVALNVALRDAYTPQVVVAFSLIAAAMAYKIGAFPFHSWAIDVFDAAHPALSALMAGIPKVAVGLALMLLAHRAVFTHLASEVTLWIFAALALASMLFGALGGLAQTAYTRMLAYSGVAQVGFALLALTAGTYAGVALAVSLTTYAIGAMTAFLAAAWLGSLRPWWDGSIAQMAGIGREHPLLGAMIAIAMLSLAGLPLTAGFWGKLLVLGAVLSTGYWWLGVAAAVALVIAFGYYGSVVRTVYFAEPLEPERLHDTSASDSPAAPLPDVAASTVSVILGAALVVGGALPLAVGLNWIMRALAFG